MSSLSLVPYHPREGREIVLRHHDAIVVRDSSSQRLEIRGLTACPTCHQPLRSPSPERTYDSPSHRESFVDPDYFRMLRAGHSLERPDRTPSSPTRRLVQPVRANERSSPVPQNIGDAEFVSSTPAVPPEGSRIKREAFSPNYFNTFFVEERELGRGGKGVVILVRHEIDGCQLGHFACKRVPVGDDHAWLEKVLIEVELLAKLSHPNLVSYRHVWLEDVRLSRFAPPVACAFILQQYCNGGDLLHYVAGDGPKEATKEELKAQMRRRSKGQIERAEDLFAGQRLLPLEEIYPLFRDITSGLAYLHAANYIHRDLKPSNCLLHREGKSLTCLISDFGEVQAENAVRKSTGSTGTISYCAPEVLRIDTATGRYGNFTAKSDIFSLGMILYFMCFGRLPYQSANAIQEELEDIDLLRAEITHWTGFQDERRERPDLPGKLYQLLKKLLSLDPSERPTASEVLTVLKNESSLDGVGRERSASPTRSFQRGRVHNLDSPIATSSPVPGLFTSVVDRKNNHAEFRGDPTKQAKVASASQGELSGTLVRSISLNSNPSAAQSSLQPHASSHAARYRATATSESQNEDQYSSMERRHSEESVSTPRPSPPTSPPLLMPPPTTFFAEVRHRGNVAQHQMARYVSQHSDTVFLFFRLMLFLVKMATLTRPCWPYMISTGIAASLVAVAGLDLGLPGVQEPRGPRRIVYGGNAAGQQGNSMSRWRWDWRASIGLFVMHFFVLWTTSKQGVLCPVPRDAWVHE